MVVGGWVGWLVGSWTGLKPLFLTIFFLFTPQIEMISKVVPKYYIFILLLEAGVSVLRPEPFVSLVDPSIASSRRGSLSSSGVSAGHLVINRPNTVQSSDANNSECLFSKNTFRSKFRFNIFSPI